MELEEIHLKKTPGFSCWLKLPHLMTFWLYVSTPTVDIERHGSWNGNITWWLSITNNKEFRWTPFSANGNFMGIRSNLLCRIKPNHQHPLLETVSDPHTFISYSINIYSLWCSFHVQSISFFFCWLHVRGGSKLNLIMDGELILELDASFHA